MESSIEVKKNRLFVLLSGIFLTNALVAEMIGVKIFSGEATIGLQPANLSILGFSMNFNLTAGALIWPMVFVTTDLINEYFGQAGVKRISILTAMFIGYAFLVIFITMKLPPSQIWLDAYKKDPSGNAFNINYAFTSIFGQGMRIIGASLSAFILGQLVDVFIFHQLRNKSGPHMLWLRATGSTLVSQFIDSFVVLYIAFFGIFSSKQLIAIGLTNYIYKFCVAILLTPLIYIGHYFIDRYLGKEDAERIAEEAAHRSQRFL